VCNGASVEEHPKRSAKSGACASHRAPPALGVGCPSCGGQRTDFCPRTTPLAVRQFIPLSFRHHARSAAPSARAVRPLAASEPAFAPHRHRLRTTRHRALWTHRPRSRAHRVQSACHFAGQQPFPVAHPGSWSPRLPQVAPATHRTNRTSWLTGSRFPSTIQSPTRQTRAVLPNPSFNLTRSGLRPPRAS
jgi:hypothetical protein